MVRRYGDLSGGTTAVDTSGQKFDSQGYQDALGKILYLQSGSRQFDPNAAISELNRYGDVFANEFKQQVGRDPTAQEASKFYSDIVTPQGTFPGGAYPGIPQLQDLTRSYVGNTFSQTAADEQKNQIDQKSQAGQADVKSAFQSTLGRDPTQDELDHFSKMIGTGNADSYTLSQALQQLPEYMQARDKQNRADLESELSANDTKFYNDQILPTIQSQYALSGRSIDPNQSSALASAFANAAKSLNQTRSDYIAKTATGDYNFDRQAAINSYLQSTDRANQLTDQATARKYALQDQTTARANELNDYGMQQAAYENFLRNYGRRSSPNSIGSAIGTGLGAITGGLFGGAAGAGVGATVGGSVGGLFNKY